MRLLKRLALIAVAVMVFLLLFAKYDDAARLPAPQKKQPKPAPANHFSSRPAEPKKKQSPPKQQRAELSMAEFSELLIKELGTTPAHWGSIEVTDFDPSREVKAIIYYSRPPSGYAMVQADTTRLVRACIAVLMSHGINPKERNMFIYGRGRQLGRGETGSETVRMFGRSSFSPFSDTISFEKDK